MVAEKKRFPLMFVLLPLLAVVGIAGVVGLNLYREYQKSEAEEAEAQRQLQVAQEQKLREATRPPEVKVEAPPEEDEDLANLPKGQKKKPVKPVSQTPAQRAWHGFKTAFEKLEAANESAAKKFRAKKLALDDQYNDGKPANEAKFVADCDATKEKILEALRNPENQ